jgi:hypothetical protein
MNREKALEAVDHAFDDGIARCYDIFVEGLEIGTPVETLAARFRRGLAFHCDAHGKLTAVVEDYFKGVKT